MPPSRCCQLLKLLIPSAGTDAQASLCRNLLRNQKCDLITEYKDPYSDLTHLPLEDTTHRINAPSKKYTNVHVLTNFQSRFEYICTYMYPNHLTNPSKRQLWFCGFEIFSFVFEPFSTLKERRWKAESYRQQV